MTGDIAAWFTAVGTVGAFAVSLWLLHSQRHDRRADLRLAQAEKVSAWAEGVSDDGEHFVVAYVVRNGSESPIYEVELRMPTGTQGTFVRYLGMMGPRERRRVHVLVGRAQPVGDRSPEVMFVDSAEQRWIRGRLGTLTQPSPEAIQVHSKQDPGAYDNIVANPYLNLRLEGEPRDGERFAD